MIKNNKKTITALLLLSIFSPITPVVQAAPFEIAVAPSRFEVTADRAQRLGQSIEIQNLGATATELSVRTLDWSYSDDGKVTYYDELRPNSCRPWVTLERSLVSVPAKGKKSFRFQVDVPANATATECRFMLAIEGVEPAHRTLIAAGGANLNLPVSGRIAVAVYIAVDGAEPELKIGQVSVQTIKGKRLPVVTVTNQGDAHGRLSGILSAMDAMGQNFELVPDSTPILPGQTRRLTLYAQNKGQAPTASIHYPIQSKGTLDWEKGSFKLNATFK